MKSIFVRTLSVCAFAACFFAAGNPASAYFLISTDTVWRLNDSPKVTTEKILIPHGRKLTIEPGVVVKFNSPYQYERSIENNGILEAIGTPDMPIIFTSIHDDAAGGDTNNNGTSTSPQSGDWLSLTSNQGSYPDWASMRLNNVIVRYGGNANRNVIVNNFSTVEIKNSVITRNKLGLLNNYGSYIITNSSIYDNDRINNIEYSLENIGGIIVSAQNNWWGTPEGPCPWRLFVDSAVPDWRVTLPEACGSRPVIDSRVLYSPWLTKPPEPEADKLNPVIIIPGLLGSWPDMEGKKLILDPIIHTYDDLWQALTAAGYSPGVSLFAFPYEWRRSNVVSAQLLKQKIIDAKAACVPSEILDCSKVDLIGHSMGGLVARQYIASADYGDDVDQMIFIATPQKGAPKAYAAWEGGYWGDTIEDKFLKMILTLEAGKKTSQYSDLGLVTYLHDYNIDSVKELLPIYPYIYDENLGQVRYYPDNYPINPFLENLNSEDNLEKLKTKVKVTNIIGNGGADTITGFNIVDSSKPLPLWENGMPKDFYSSKSGILTGSGDGTVPAVSNSSFLGMAPIIVNQDHGNAVSYAQRQVIKDLTGSEPAAEIHNFRLLPNLLMVSLRCPADIQVIAPDGKRLGRDSASSSTLAEIPGGYYYYSDDSLMPEFAIIPNPQDGEYQIKVVGTDNGGSYVVDVDYITNASSTAVSYSGVILAGQEQFLKLDFDPANGPTEEIRAGVTIQTAIDDVSLLYGRGLLTDKNAKKKLIQQYNLIRLKVEISDKLADLALKAVKKLDDNTKLKSPAKEKLIAVAKGALDKLLLNKQRQISEEFADMEKYLQKLLTSGVLKQLGYDIIKSNNDYLTSNL